MITVTPQGQVYICKTPLENDYKNQLTFATKVAQESYFNSTIIKSLDNYTYMKKDNVIKVGINIDEIIDCNYLFYRNTGFSNKIYYCFITKMEYIGENVTAITIETDCFQTWYFDIRYKKCFVEREHVNDDTIGAHTIPENLETGDYISCKLQPSFYSTPETCFVVATTEQITQQYATFNQLLPIGLYYYGLTTLQGIKDLIKKLDDAGKGDTINSVFVALKDFFYGWSTMSGVDGQISASIRFDYSNEIEVAKVNYLGNEYTPRNKKLLTFPYSFLQVSNHSGQIINYHWENFNLLDIASDNKVKFNIRGTITPSGSMKAFPVNYNNILNNNDDNIVIGKLPIGAFNNDVYTNWLTQNGVNIGLNVLSSGIQIASGIATGNVAGAVSGGLGIANTMASVYQHSLIPDSVSGNVNCGDVNFTLGLTNLEFKRMSIKNEYARIIDNYFDMFGYKVNDVKIPNITGRQNWNYVKTIDCNFDGDIPQTDLNIIKAMFDGGVTFWHNPDNIFNYSLSNNII
jgi:hypothetical protein